MKLLKKELQKKIEQGTLEATNISNALLNAMLAVACRDTYDPDGPMPDVFGNKHDWHKVGVVYDGGKSKIRASKELQFLTFEMWLAQRYPKNLPGKYNNQFSEIWKMYWNYKEGIEEFEIE